MSTGVVVDKVETALRWRERAGAEPGEALLYAQQWLSEGNTAELRVLARHIACLAEVERGQLAAARRHGQLGLVTASRSALHRRAAQLRLTLAWIELDGGASDACREHLDAAEPLLRGADLTRAAYLRALMRCGEDRPGEAITALTEVLPWLRGEGDQRWVANALLGRGVACLYANRLDQANADLAEAEELFTSAGWPARAAACQHNRGCVAFRAGDLPEALRLFEQALRTGLDTDSNPEVLVDRAEALAAAGMTSAARENMRRAAARLEDLGRWVRLAETRLALAGRALRDGDHEAAIEQARESRRLFQSQRRPAWASLATAVILQARLAAGEHSRRVLATARRAGMACAEHGWTAVAAELWLTAGRAASDAGMITVARRLLGLAAAHREEPPATAQQRAAGWLAEALLASLDGDRAQVFESCRAGLRDVGSHVAATGAIELRIRASGLADELTGTAIGAALEEGDPALLLRWVESSRASALSHPAVRPPADTELGSALVRLRSAVCALHRSHPGQPRAALDEVAALEEQVRHRAMLVGGEDADLPATWPDVDLDAVRTGLGESVLVSLFVHSGILHVIWIVDGRIRTAARGEIARISREGRKLGYLLDRLAVRAGSAVSARFAEQAARCAQVVEERVLGPVLPDLAEGRPLVVVPTGSLHSLCWAALPSCAGRSVTVTPSLRCWSRAAWDARLAADDGRAVWVCGPDLEHAEREVRALHQAAGGQLLVGPDARTNKILTSVDGSALVHIAAHGTFRRDQPLLSCLDMDDGPLYGYDLDHLQRGPRTVVLSACEVGRSVVSRGDELMGLAATLLGRGTVTLIASVIPVPDERTARVMLSLHKQLRHGVPPATALAKAQAEHGESGFICLGYGGPA